MRIWQAGQPKSATTLFKSKSYFMHKDLLLTAARADPGPPVLQEGTGRLPLCLFTAKMPDSNKRKCSNKSSEVQRQ